MSDPTKIPCPNCGGDGGERIGFFSVKIDALCDKCDAEKQADWKQKKEYLRDNLKVR